MYCKFFEKHKSGGLVVVKRRGGSVVIFLDFRCFFRENNFLLFL